MKYLTAGLLVVAMTLLSSWFGALLWAQSFPTIIEYRDQPKLLDGQGRDLFNPTSGFTEVHQGDWVIFTAAARRQPVRCWGEFIYVAHSPLTNYQFPMLRSFGLTKTVQDYRVKNLFEIPPGLPVGDYDWDVVIYPYCDSVPKQPTTVPLRIKMRVLPPVR